MKPRPSYSKMALNSGRIGKEGNPIDNTNILYHIPKCSVRLCNRADHITLDTDSPNILLIEVILIRFLL